MSLLDVLDRLWRAEARHLVYAPIPPERQTPAMDEIALVPEQHYLRVWLSEMFLRDDRRLFRQFVPVVHSNVCLHYGSKAAQELPYVAGPQNVGLGTTLGKGVQLNHPLTNCLPYRGGLVTIAAALVAYKEKDFFRELVGVLNGVSSLLNVGQLSSTLEVLGGAMDGIQGLLGAGDKDVHLVFFQGYAGLGQSGGNSLKSGYSAVVRADAAEFDSQGLAVKDGGLYRQASKGPAMRPLSGFDYMLLRLEALQTRDDFLAFDEFAKLLQDAIREGSADRGKGDAIIQAAQVVAWASADLTIADRLRVAQALKRVYEQALSQRVRAEAFSPAEPMRILNDEILSVRPEIAIRDAAAFLNHGPVRLQDFLQTVK